MLLRLILFVLAFGGLGFVGWRWFRGRRLDRSGGLDVFEIERLMKIAKTSQRVQAAMVLRVNIVEAASADEKKSVSAKVDAVLRRLAQQESLRQRVKETLGKFDLGKLKVQLTKAEADADGADGERKLLKDGLVRQLKTQIDQIMALYTREDDLDAHAERMMMELKNVHLALLNASSTEAVSDAGSVSQALAHLEETTEELRQQTSAEAEVDRLIRAAQAQAAQR